MSKILKNVKKEANFHKSLSTFGVAFAWVMAVRFRAHCVKRILVQLRKTLENWILKDSRKFTFVGIFLIIIFWKCRSTTTTFRNLNVTRFS